MRQIKFRIWNTLMKLWLCEDSQYLQMDGKKVHAAPWSTMEWDIPSEEYVIQQYTGLKDSKGVDIYEGDILEIQRFEKNNFDKKYIQNGVVEFSTGSFLFTPLEKDNDNYYTYINFQELFKYSKTHLAYYTPKIIGNIFESKELLNNEN